MKKIIEYIKNKKLWAVGAAFAFLFLCLPATAHAHSAGAGLGLILICGVWAIAMIIAIVMLILIIAVISSFWASLLMAIINGTLFFYVSSMFFGRRDTIQQFWFFGLTFATICLLNTIIAIFKNATLSRCKYAVLVVVVVYILLAVRSVWLIRYQTPCMEAINEGNKEKVAFYIKKLGVNKKIKGDDIYSGQPKPMIVIAANERQPEIVKMMVLKGANYIDESIISVLAGTGDIKLVKKLLDRNKASRNYLTNYKDITIEPIDMKFINLKSATLAKQYDMIEFLISRGASAQTAIETASAKQDVETIHFLLDKGFIDKDLALYYVAKDGNIEQVKQFLKQGANANVVNKAESIDGVANRKRTALMEAAVNGHLEIVKLLIDAGADVNAKDKTGATALAQIKIDSSSPKNTEEIVKLLVASGAEINAKDEYQGNILMKITKNSPEIVRLAISKGADVNAKDKRGNTPLIQAASWDDVKTVQLLINAGADVNAKNNDGTTALLNAIQWDRYKNVKVLLDAGADPNAKDKDDCSPLRLAMLSKKHGRNEDEVTEVIRLLLVYGGDRTDAVKYMDEFFKDTSTMTREGSIRAELQEMLNNTNIKTNK